MAVKVATKITLSIKELFNALVAKTTPLYAGKDNWGKYNYEEVIYPQARAAFKDLYPTSLYPTTEEFLNRFKRDYYKKDKALQKIVNKGEHGQENEIVFNQSTEATAETPISGTPTGEPAQTMAGGFPHLPSSGSGPQAPRVRFIQSQPISTPVTDKAERFAQENPATAKINRLNQPASTQTPSIQTGRKTEIPKVFEDAFKNEPVFKTDPTIATAPTPHTPSPQINPTSPKKVNFSAFRPPSSAVNAVKNFSSRAGVFFQRNIGKHLTTGRIATFASSGIGAVAGAGFGGMGMVGGGIAGAALPSWVRSGGAGRFLGKVGNGAINTVSGFSNKVTNKGLLGSNNLLKKSSKRIVWIFLGFFIMFGLVAGLLGGMGDPTPSGNVGVGVPGTTPAMPGGPVTHPVPPTVNPSELRQRIIDTFGITMNGYDDQHLQYAYEKFYEVSGTRFISFIRGSTVLKVSSDTRQVGCPSAATSVQLDQYPEALFKYALIHEFGHVIANCPGATSNYRQQQYDAYTAEGGITYYARNAWACTGSNNKDEDYAEMIALYLNPSANIQIARCTPGGTPYTNLNSYPLHYNVARSILGDF